ncbi:F-type H+-transporting ATPase subunit b [Staphylococcus auricularis]|uniref:ATP synthase subunit b n=1 Tax=Staphylococcus auricularis TaxID=29379 RepID=A0AAP8TTZ8_9STAP|nr:F0F1 ATP synthase subunit B [Staphylococcus auricularis]MBM0869009.1 F0F1 ATP synthase subunit B [Staphylococcus auricularis]MCG7341864.1 F0F1 ATP synthase subunit B [Staphylococcus auricularis]MDC6328070.1 F0F1 ATP synthase subunit B [Staphylococcus auricularis]MDN4534200.1 F0F1 ATP synthase subunit B [Staphylococcus auricularis]PNZ69201.1 ATP synthase F0 subunit B [Staphylococcus auricularis]
MTATINTFVLGANLNVEWGTMIITLFTFLVLLALLKKFAWGPLKDIMDQRQNDINKDIDDAEQAKLNAQKLEEENNQTLKATQQEVQKILEDAKLQAREQQEQIIHEANTRANGMIETAQNEINSQKERALADINNQISQLSVSIAAKVLNKEISEEDQKALVDKYIKEAGDK